MANNTEATTATNAPAPAPADVELPTRPATTEKPVKARSVYELCEASTNSMSRAEAMKYIKYLRSENETANKKIQQLEENAKSAYEKVRILEQQLTLINASHDEVHDFVLSSLSNTIKAMQNIRTVNTIKRGNI